MYLRTGPNVCALKLVFLSPFYVVDAVVMKSEGFKYIEESCSSLLSDLLETFALSMDEKSGPLLGRKRNLSSSTMAMMDLAPAPEPAPADGAAAPAESNGRRVRRRV